jgi:hypothetical protein
MIVCCMFLVGCLGGVLLKLWAQIFAASCSLVVSILLVARVNASRLPFGRAFWSLTAKGTLELKTKTPSNDHDQTSVTIGGRCPQPMPDAPVEKFSHRGLWYMQWRDRTIELDCCMNNGVACNQHVRLYQNGGWKLNQITKTKITRTKPRSDQPRLQPSRGSTKWDCREGDRATIDNRIRLLWLSSADIFIPEDFLGQEKNNESSFAEAYYQVR